MVSATRGETSYGICSTDFLEHALPHRFLHARDHLQPGRELELCLRHDAGGEGAGRHLPAPRPQHAAQDRRAAPQSTGADRRIKLGVNLGAHCHRTVIFLAGREVAEQERQIMAMRQIAVLPYRAESAGDRRADPYPARHHARHRPLGDPQGPARGQAPAACERGAGGRGRGRRARRHLPDAAGLVPLPQEAAVRRDGVDRCRRVPLRGDRGARHVEGTEANASGAGSPSPMPRTRSTSRICGR